MKKILKYSSLLISVVALALGCSKDDTIDFQPDTNKSGEVTLLASIENAGSRASIVATGEARWQKEEQIAVICSDNSIVNFQLDGTGDTRRALFKANVGEKSIGEYAFYPAASSFADNTISTILPAEIAISPSGQCTLMAGTINALNEIEFKQLLAYVSLQLSNIHNTAKKIVISANNNLSGNISAKLPEALTEGVPAKAGNASITIPLGEKAPSTVNAFFGIPVGEYSTMTATAYNENEVALGEVKIIASAVKAERGLLLTSVLEMPDYVPEEEPVEIPGTVYVAGVYWAKGNLEYEKGGESGTGFASGWRIAPHQAHYHDAAMGKTRSYENYDKRDVFNLGGITDPFDCEAASAAIAAPNVVLAGKMYTDQTCTTETTDFAAAKFGDIAFWASNGQYRMPSCEDIQKLIDNASAKMATYTLDGNEIKGIYYYDPKPGEEKVVNLDETITLTDADMDEGLFLPYNGRGYNKSSVKDGRDNRHDVFNTGTNCIYHIAETREVDPSTKNFVEGSCYGYTFNVTQADNAETNFGLAYLNGAMNVTARLAIRPIYAGDPGDAPTPTPPSVRPEPVEGDWGEGTPGGAIGENPYGGEL